MKIVPRLSLALAALGLSAGIALGAGPTVAPADPFVGAAPVAISRWNAQVTPYVWGAGVGGAFTPFTGAPGLAFSTSFSEVLEDLEAAFFISGFARRDRLVFLGDASYVSSAKSGAVPPGLPAEGRLRQSSLTLAGGYRVVEGPGPTFDVLAGLRAWRISAEIDVAGGAVSASPTVSFVDPIIAFRVLAPLSPRWSALFYADAGGFGVGSESTYQVVGTLNYAISDRATVSGGFRTLSVDYRDGGTVLDATLSGPLLGLTFQF